MLILHNCRSCAHEFIFFIHCLWIELIACFLPVFRCTQFLNNYDNAIDILMVFSYFQNWEQRYEELAVRYATLEKKCDKLIAENAKSEERLVSKNYFLIHHYVYLEFYETRSDIKSYFRPTFRDRIIHNAEYFLQNSMRNEDMRSLNSQIFSSRHFYWIRNFLNTTSFWDGIFDFLSTHFKEKTRLVNFSSVDHIRTIFVWTIIHVLREDWSIDSWISRVQIIFERISMSSRVCVYFSKMKFVNYIE